MTSSLQFESHRGELAFIYQLEHDAAVLEFYDPRIVQRDKLISEVAFSPAS